MRGKKWKRRKAVSNGGRKKNIRIVVRDYRAAAAPPLPANGTAALL